MQTISSKARTIAKQGKMYICYHFGRHLEYLKMLNDAKKASVRFLTGKVWATKISKEKKFEPYFQFNLGICWTMMYHHSLIFSVLIKPKCNVYTRLNRKDTYSTKAQAMADHLFIFTVFVVFTALHTTI